MMDRPSDQVDSLAFGIHHSKAVNVAGSQAIHGGQHITVTQQNSRQNLIDPITALLETLPRVDQALFDADESLHQTQCLEGTRVNVLSQIQAWMDAPDGCCIFWLSGMAGTGKSTIARTVAQVSKDRHELGGSFFFVRGSGDVSNAQKLVTSLAFQLAVAQPRLRPLIGEVLRSEPDIVSRPRKDQWAFLIAQPLNDSSQSKKRKHDEQAVVPALVFVLDALDECANRNDDVVRVIHLLASARDAKNWRVRILVTSRPEMKIREEFERPFIHHLTLALHNVTQSDVDADIRRYFYSEFEKIRRKFKTSKHWPISTHVEQLVQASGGLFIFAATVCRFIYEARMPPEESISIFLPSALHIDQFRPQEGMRLGHSGHGIPTNTPHLLDGMYRQILDQANIQQQSTGGNDRAQRGTLDVLAILAVSEETLSVESYAGLLGVHQSAIHMQLNDLHSVVRISDTNETPIRLYHTSFRDFLLDPSRSGKHCVDVAATHQMLSEQCLRRMQGINGLKNNMLGITYSGEYRAAVSPLTVQEKIPADLAYACRYWSLHLERGQKGFHDADDLHKFLQSHFLNWLEALGWLGRIWDVGESLNQLQTCAQRTSNTISHAFLEDALRFTLYFRYMIDLAPLQIYSAPFIFAPKESAIRKTFQAHLADMVTFQVRTPSRWGGEIQRLEGHKSRVFSVTFSPDGRTIATTSHRKATLQNVATGEEIMSFDFSGFFSPDTEFIAIPSYMTLRLSSLKTGEEVRTIDCEVDISSVIVFTPDGQNVAVFRQGRQTVRIWNLATGMEIQKFHCGGEVLLVTFSPDGQTVAIDLQYKTTELWNLMTGEEVQKLVHGRWDNTLMSAFSPDGRVIATGAVQDYYGAVRLWNLLTGDMTQKFELDDEITSLIFSPDGQVIAVGSQRNTVRLWNPFSRQEVRKFECDSCATSLAFSPDGQAIATGLDDGTVRIFSTNGNDGMHQPETHQNPQDGPTSSLDKRSSATNSNDTAALPKDLEITGQHKLRGHVDETAGLQGRKHAEREARLGSLKLSPNEQILVSVFLYGPVQLWKVRRTEGTLLRWQMLPSHQRLVTIAFSPDVKFLASVGEGEMVVKLWNIANERTRIPEPKILPHDTYIEVVEFSFDGYTLASGSGRKVLLWNVNTGKLIQTFDIPSGVGSWGPRVSAAKKLQILKEQLKSQHIIDFTDPEDSAHTLIVDNEWICRGSDRLLWLPVEYRSNFHNAWDSIGNTAAIGHESGEISIFWFHE